MNEEGDLRDFDGLSLAWPDNVDRFEFEYVTTVLLRKLNWNLVSDERKSENRLVVLGEARNPDIQRLRSNETLLHLSDEGLSHPTAHYGKFRFVLRNYANPLFSPEGKTPVFTVPLGFQRGFGSRLESKPVDVLYKWTFVGA